MVLESLSGSCHFLIFRMPVSKGEATSPIVVIGGHVAPLMHPIDKSQMVAVVDGIEGVHPKEHTCWRAQWPIAYEGIKILSISPVPPAVH